MSNLIAPTGSDLAGPVSTRTDKPERRSTTKPPESVEKKRGSHDSLTERKEGAQSPRQASEVDPADVISTGEPKNPRWRSKEWLDDRKAANLLLNPDIDRKPARRNKVQPSN